MEYKHFEQTRVVSRDFIKDWFQGIRSLFGMRLRAYEERVHEAINDMFDEIQQEGNIDWHRMNQQEIQDGIMITIYGCYK